MLDWLGRGWGIGEGGGGELVAKVFINLNSQAAVKECCSMVDFAGNANQAPTTASVSIDTQGRPPFAKTHSGQFCKRWPPLRMRGGACGGWGLIFISS